jgi:CheY-like chemotaxis protein
VVLVVDDDPDTRELAATALAAAGASVLHAETVAEALHVFETTPPDIVVSDLEMPGQDGFALLGRLRRLPAPLGRVPVVALTGHARDEDRELALAAGFAAHVSKPVEPDRLLATLASLLR